MNYKKLILATILIGVFFRFFKLGFSPLWIDEVLFYHYAQDFRQEYLQGIIQQFIWLFAPMKSEFWLRFQYAFFGSLTLMLPYILIKDKQEAFIITLYLALFPLLVFWSRMARPYTIAAFFCVLGWRWPVFYVPALFCTPFSILGVNITPFFQSNKREIILYSVFYTFLIALTYFLFNIRDDSGRHFMSLEFILNAKRLWVIPFTILPFYLLYGYKLYFNRGE